MYFEIFFACFQSKPVTQNTVDKKKNKKIQLPFPTAPQDPSIDYQPIS
jgi:hypothetical protein